MLTTPVLFILFNRPGHTQRVFEQIRAVKPKHLFISADGPRAGVDADHENCRKSRSLVLENIDWDCQVKTLFREFNLGCGVAPAGAITWFFEHVEEGIILEDDCLPCPFFFEFCSELLTHYKGNERVMHIGGDNFQEGNKRGEASYYFSAYNHNWGWATWRRCWDKFEYSITDFNRTALSLNLESYGFNRRERNFWIDIFEKINEKQPKDIWDYQWVYAIWKNSGFSILPNENLVINIGFGSDATHTKLAPNRFQPMKYGKMDKLVHPGRIRLDEVADHFTFRNHFHIRDSLYRRLKNKLVLNSYVRMLYERAKKLRA